MGLHRGYIHLCWIDHFEYFAETGCKADGRVGIGIIRRFSGLGEGDNYVFFFTSQERKRCCKGVLTSKRTFFLWFGGKIIDHFLCG